MSLERNNMPTLTCCELLAIIEKKRCFRCEKSPTYFPKDESFAYCDDHYPYKKEFENLHKHV